MHLVVPPGGSFRETRRIELGPRVLTIGRAVSCEVRVDVPGVDDEHAKISSEALLAVGADCAIGDVPLDAGHRRLVTAGDEIQIGSVVLAIEGLDMRPQPGPRIRVVEGANFGEELVLLHENHEYIIGRSKTADLRLEDREVSREHLKIVRRGWGVFIFDQASTRGSWLGRSAVYQGSKMEWELPRMLKVGATVLALDLPPGARPAMGAAQASAPMTAPPRTRPPAEVHFTPSPDALAAGPPANVVAYHYDAKAPPESGAAMHPSIPPSGGVHPSLPPSQLTGGTSANGRAGWKKGGPAIGKTSGLLLLALAGIAILGVLFVVFSLME